MKPKKYLPGSTWGGWTVICKVPDESGPNCRYWCRCEGCGKRAKVPGSSLYVNRLGCLACSTSHRHQGAAKYPISITEIMDRTGYTKGGVTSRIRRFGYPAALAFFLPQAAKELTEMPRRNAAPPAPIDPRPEPTPAPPPKRTWVCRLKIASIECEGSADDLAATLEAFRGLMNGRQTRPATEPGRETRG